MSDYGDIIDGAQANTSSYGLVYTKKCGWIDLGHAEPTNARRLWQSIRDEPPRRINPRSPYFYVQFGQRMGKYGVSAGVKKWYRVQRGLTVDQKKSVALAIFLDVSRAFERYQGSYFFSLFTNSSFSGEDLISNLISFYRALGFNYIDRCDPVDKSFAQAIWHRHGSIETHKNRKLRPYLFHDGDQVAASRRRGTLPVFLKRIEPAAEGMFFWEHTAR